jgi:hypothetical protein
MVVDNKTGSAIGKNDAIHIIILLAIAAGIGIYLITTTVLIAKDAMRYIPQAQQFSIDTISAIRGEPFRGEPSGYPFLIYVIHKLVVMFGGSNSEYSWMYSAQAVSLLCRLGALVALYFIGKLLTGGRQSFWAVLILVVLPYPAKFGSDILRDWPYILFLVVGFLVLLLAANQGKWWMFGLVGLIAALGHMIRPECAQLVIYGAAWLMIGFFLPNLRGTPYGRSMTKPKIACALAILIAGFIIPAAPYMKIRGKILPTKLEQLLSSSQLQSDEGRQHNYDDGTQIQTASTFAGSTAMAFSRLFGRIGENLMYFFAPALLIGLYHRFRRLTLTTTAEKFFIATFIFLNVTMMILLYHKHGYISRRHCLPLTVLTIFYVPIGLVALADWLRKAFCKNQPEPKKNSQIFTTLLIIGVIICLPKLLKPLRIEKQGYRDVAKWLNTNSTPEDIIAVTDSRTAFYAQRQAVTKSQQDKANYAVDIVKKGKDENKKPSENWRQVYSATLKKKYKLVVYKKII